MKLNIFSLYDSLKNEIYKRLIYIAILINESYEIFIYFLCMTHLIMKTLHLCTFKTPIFRPYNFIS